MILLKKLRRRTRKREAIEYSVGSHDLQIASAASRCPRNHTFPSMMKTFQPGLMGPEHLHFITITIVFLPCPHTACRFRCRSQDASWRFICSPSRKCLSGRARETVQPLPGRWSTSHAVHDCTNGSFGIYHQPLCFLQNIYNIRAHQFSSNLSIGVFPQT